MPLIILYLSDHANLAVLSADTDDDVLSDFNKLPDTPSVGHRDEVKRWLMDQPFPSGWYESAEEARARVQQCERHEPMAPGELAQIRATLGEPRAHFAAQIGFRGSPNTRHKQIWEMERDRKPILPERARSARALLALRHLADL